jgi:phosphatidylserine decarboxylase
MVTHTGWDMVVISFAKKNFRNRIIRRSFNPFWDERLLFHVREYESTFKVHLTVLDWSKLPNNDNVGDTSFKMLGLVEVEPRRVEKPELYESGMGVVG